MTKLRVGLAGCGMVSRHHLLAWSRSDAAEVVALADPDPVQREKRAAEFAIPAAYADAAEMLAREKVEALDIAAPVQVHAELVDLAVARGIPVLCQKPLAGSLESANRIAMAADGKIRLMVHENWRFRPHYRRIAAWLSEGRIGEPRAFQFEVMTSALLDRPDGAPPPGLTRQPFLAKMRRLLVLELLVHHLDVLRFLFGPLSIHAAQLKRISPHVVGEDTATIALSAGETGGTVFASMAAAGAPPRSRDALEILGSHGRIAFRAGVLLLCGREEERIAIDFDADYQASYDAAIDHFVRCLGEGEPFETAPFVHLEVLSAMERIYQLGQGGLR